MRMHEYQAKEVFARYGIRVPRGSVASSAEEAAKIAEELGGRVVVKAQVLVGGRGKAGGVKKASSAEEAAKIAEELLGSRIKGHIVEKVLVEEQLEIEREMYVGFTIDRASRGIAAILSSVGGMDIEEIAAEHPEKIATLIVNPKWGLWDYHVRDLLRKSGVERELWREVGDIVKKLYRIMVEFDAELTEINPLALTPDGLVAADARLNVDDNALFRHPELEELRELTEENELEREAARAGLNYVQLEGDIGIMANGAGMAMATMDLIKLMGGKPANFLDVGGGASEEAIAKALEILLKSGVRAIYINIFGGITRCDEVARGIVRVLGKRRVDIPIVVRLAGTNEEEGRRILAESNLNLIVVSEMEEGAKKVVELAG
ncbi:MAG: ADP-forming succinate--CoA ligase subunit beta [Archaeoglobaceae archaeon]